MTQVFREAVSLEQLNTLSRNTAIASLGIVFSAAGDDWLQATMPVDERTRQPYGILHGGASVVLAETLGSSAGNLCVDTAKQICVGLEINANHVRAVRSGTVTGTARASHTSVRSSRPVRRATAASRVIVPGVWSEATTEKPASARRSARPRTSASSPT